MTIYPRPNAIGLVHLSASAPQAQRTEARIALAVRAAEEGYALIETYETGGNRLKEDVALQALEDLASRLDVVAVFYSGDVNHARVREIAERLRLVIMRVA
jgi:hypothetical protein